MKKIILLVSALLPSNVFGAPADLNFDYGFKSELIYSDGTELDDMNLAVTTTRQSSRTSVGGTRTLGLKELSFDLKFANKNTEAFFRLRPDATIDRGLASDVILREQDTRSGEAYRLSPKLNFLDLYRFTFFKSDSFLFSYGVRDYAYKPINSYESPLDFGLEVWFPRKFASVSVIWKLHRDMKNSLDETKPARFSFELFSLESSNDRHEKTSQQTSTSDTGLIASDPHTGIGFTGSYRHSTTMSARIFSAYLDSKVDFGRKNRLMLAIDGNYYGLISDRKVLMSYDARYSRESWSISQDQYPRLEQLSHSLKTELVFNNSWSLFLGLSQGVSQRPLGSSFGEKEIQTGHQIDLGYRRTIYDHLKLSFVITDETRKNESAGIETGGFQLEEGAGKHLNRLAFNIVYEIL